MWRLFLSARDEITWNSYFPDTFTVIRMTACSNIRWFSGDECNMTFWCWICVQAVYWKSNGSEYFWWIAANESSRYRVLLNEARIDISISNRVFTKTLWNRIVIRIRSLTEWLSELYISRWFRSLDTRANKLYRS